MGTQGENKHGTSKKFASKDFYLVHFMVACPLVIRNQIQFCTF